jgi:alkylhydroperoxidase/carboxymuconolactone decarboxylase family protein YurZ
VTRLEDWRGETQPDEGDHVAEFEYITERGRRAVREMFGPDSDGMLDAYAQRWTDRVDADWTRIIVGYVTEGMYSRQVLSPGQRELCAVAALTVLQRTEELERHIDIALNTNRVEEVREVILQMSVYGGVPVTFSTLTILDKVLADRAARDGSAE